MDTFDSDAGYRARLAEAVQSLLRSTVLTEVEQRSEVRQLIHSSMYGGQFDGAASSLLESDVIALSKKLRDHPDLQSRLALLTEYSTSKWLLEQELLARHKMQPGQDAYERAKDVRAVGVCFSGGGIRSATFNLGILQGLAKLRKLSEIDYISSVSGGGYVHQFLAAWIKNESAKVDNGLTSVEEKLIPIPDADSGRINAPEPIRWLRRYSNYLSPSISVFGADVWTMVEVWIRNTALNFSILTCTIMCLLLVPHLALTEWALKLHLPEAFVARCFIFLLLLLTGVGAAGFLWYAFPRYCAKAEHEGMQAGNDSCPEDKTQPWHPYAITIAWLIVSVFSSGVAYRMSLPGGNPYNKIAQRAYSASPNKQQTRIGRAWGDKPPLALPAWLPGLPAKHQARLVYGKQRLTPDNQASDALRPKSERQHPERKRPVNWSEESPLIWLYESLPLLYALFCWALWPSRKETTGPVGSVLSFLCPLPAAVFATVVVYVIEHLFFALSFAVNQQHVTALGVAFLPSFLLAVPFVALEFYGGLMGTLYASAQREWIARLRAVSFQLGVGWLVVGLIALEGPHVVHWIGHYAAVKYSVWSAWGISTISGVILGKSRSTNGKPKASADGEKSNGLSAQELVVKIVPPVFTLGLFLLLSDLTGWLLAGDHVGQPHEPTARWVFLMLGLGITGGLLAWRVDINEFSMNSFYRDRLARCYAGASNRERKPNLFTGFDYRDNKWRVTGLLPKSWTGLDGKPGLYDGPFPIFCTALNITTGRELAYQERKAASFAITPLYSGYSTGWTDATNCALQYNGFVPTARHIKQASNGITMASAVAISGAAASPNMGFHSSPPMAFLMTVFNVRLGWWLRNTRHRQAYDSPAFGLFYLLNELRGATDDTSRYVYLSDGGHFENMGLYELVRRRCRTIVVCDAEADSDLCFEGIGMAIRKARIDFGVEINITGVLAPSPAPNAVTIATSHLAVEDTPSHNAPTGAEGLLEFKHFPGNLFHALKGEIIYPEDGDETEPARLLYIKSSLNGNEPPDILNYHRVHPNFPFDTTLDQFFTESQFESYRRLGQHVALEETIAAWLKDNLVRS
ncbi:hypothetical protein JAO32_08305 [Terriglobus sp. ADX1]